MKFLVALSVNVKEVLSYNLQFTNLEQRGREYVSDSHRLPYHLVKGFQLVNFCIGAQIVECQRVASIHALSSSAPDRAFGFCVNVLCPATTCMKVRKVRKYGLR